METLNKKFWEKRDAARKDSWHQRKEKESVWKS